VRTSHTLTSKLTGSLYLDNVQLNNVATAAVYDTGSARTVLSGGTTNIASWTQGNIFTGTGGSYSYKQASASPPSKPSVLLDSAGRFFGRAQPQYESYSASQFVSARSQGARGDGMSPLRHPEDGFTEIYQVLRTTRPL
jgi:glucan 1,3-beta-glucosidase